MSLTLVTAPVDIGASDLMAVEHLRLGSWPPEDHAILDTYIEVATARLDGRDGLLGRALITQQWEYRLSSFPGEIRVPLPPCQSIDSIKYIDKDDVEQTLPTADYQVFGIHSTVNTNFPAALQATLGTTYDSGPATITPATGKSFPSTKSDHQEAVTVLFTAGYGLDFVNVPLPLQQAILMDVGHMYENRESFIVGQSFTEVPMGYMALISNYRQWSF